MSFSVMHNNRKLPDGRLYCIELLAGREPISHGTRQPEAGRETTFPAASTCGDGSIRDGMRPSRKGKGNFMEDKRRLERSDCLGKANMSTPHDKGYKKSLSRPGEFLHFLKKYVGADWMMEIRETDLSLCDKEMLERDYDGKEADLIYKVKLPGGREAFVFILQELQSTVDYTMIFRVMVYVVNTLVKHFMDTERVVREREGFRLPAMVPIVFYNGLEKWTAADSLRAYQYSGDVFGDYVLNLKYYLVNLTAIEEEYILSTNTVLDNIMYCDKFRKKLELAVAIRTAYARTKELDSQEQEEFRNWVKYILLSICENKEVVVEEILRWAGDGEDDMAFKYNIIRAFEEERAEGKAEGILELLEDIGTVPETLRKEIQEQKNLEILSRWHKRAARVGTIDEFERFLKGETSKKA